MKNKILEEIKEMCRKAIRKTDDKILNESVDVIDKKTFVSIGGSFDSIILMVEELEKRLSDENDG